MRRIVSGLLLSLMFVGLFSSASVFRVEASGTIYIRADGRVDPPTANITTTDNVTYTFTNNNYDSIVVERSNIIIDGAGCTLQGKLGNGTGFDVSGINDVTIRNTNIKNFHRGVWLYRSNNNTVSGNNITDNKRQGAIRGVGVLLSQSSNNTVSENNIANNTVGVQLYSSSNNTVSANNITNSIAYGIYSEWHSSNNIIVNNSFTYSGANTIFLHDTYNSIVSNNRIDSANCIGLRGANGNTISNNVVTNSGWGIVLLASSNNSTSNNTIINNLIENITNSGIYLIGSWWDPNALCSNNVVWGNTIVNASPNGIVTQYSYNNKIFHNNFINNIAQVYSESSVSSWDDGYPSGGNYWSDYIGGDGNGDGIGDTPYIIDINNRDDCPLMNPWNPALPPVGNSFVSQKIKVKFAINDVRFMDLDEYLKGVLSAEMGTGWPIEALKAQAVAARTFAMRNTHHDHVYEDVCTDHECCQAWDPPAPSYAQDIEAAVSQTSSEVVTYHGWILKEALFFAWCNGHTVDSEDRFSNPKPYLKGVSCNGAKCLQHRAMYNPEICPYLMSGNDISACNCKVYDIHDPSGGGYYGHRVGMCQEGAKTMAQSGYDYVDILKHYYAEVDVVAATTAESRIMAKPQSPIDVSVSDSQNRITGFVNGTVRSEIPNSEYDQESELLTIFLPNDQYNYSVTGVDVGVYGLTLANATDQWSTVFQSNNIPIEVNATHQYTVDWAALSRAEEGVTIQVDSDGNSLFDHTFHTDNELDRIEFVAATTEHDLGITGMNISKTVVGEGYSISFKIPIINYGVYSEAFNVTISANTTLIVRQLVNLPNESATTINCTWNTTDFPLGNYTIKAHAEPVPGETFDADNTFIISGVVLTVLGDVDGDHDVDIFDIVLMAGAYGLQEGDPEYIANCDIDGDLDVDIFDIVAAAGHYGESW